ncbi:hypothetical protein [Terrabacter terrigena]|uniref:Lipoprotein n=1 Tax=Terrabacter terrigena TaxID=574718 RepID=A0ABW3MVR2_9MICO
MTHTTSVRRTLATSAVAAVIPFVAACGSGTTPPAATDGSASSTATTSSSAPSATGGAGASAYCDALKSGQKELESMSAKITDKAALEQGLGVLQKIEAAAPAEVKSSWDDFIDFVKTAAAGNTSAMAGALEKMQSASTKIATHAKATCNLDMS